jgi:hypothetical protein
MYLYLEYSSFIKKIFVTTQDPGSQATGNNEEMKNGGLTVREGSNRLCYDAL